MPILETSFAEIEQPDCVLDKASLRGLDHSRKDFVARLWHLICFLLHLHIANGVELDVADRRITYQSCMRFPNPRFTHETRSVPGGMRFPIPLCRYVRFSIFLSEAIHALI